MSEVASEQETNSRSSTATVHCGGSTWLIEPIQRLSCVLTVKSQYILLRPSVVNSLPPPHPPTTPSPHPPPPPISTIWSGTHLTVMILIYLVI